MLKKSERRADILAIYAKYGGWMSVRRLTELCWEEGVFSPEERANMAFRAAMRECANALKTKDSTGLPVAVPTIEKDAEDKKVWKQPVLLEYEEAKAYLGMLIRQQEADYRSLHLWAEFMRLTWDDAPPYPTMSFPDDEPMWWKDSHDETDQDDE